MAAFFLCRPVNSQQSYVLLVIFIWCRYLSASDMAVVALAGSLIICFIEILSSFCVLLVLSVLSSYFMFILLLS